MPQHIFLETNSSGQTKKFAGLLASVIASRKRSNLKNALVLALAGDLGSGKTTFVQGFLRGLGVRRKITSPTFVIAKSYKLKAKSYKLGYHIDCYRIEEPKELSGLGLKEILNNPENILLIEWPERIKKILPKDLVWIKFEYGEKENERVLKFKQ
ncbi:MAG: tRNA (adenosine(37)-N6)-threonylcarbamoyltransferase complex ATPase subunit type 1 TsaE [bacterium]|nr:tRNA (adenosine(37)-N6)-threonylcarbamoyltransferase complex ATPase subunit type 1 TsaE [bacterium]